MGMENSKKEMSPYEAADCSWGNAFLESNSGDTFSQMREKYLPGQARLSDITYNKPSNPDLQESFSLEFATTNNPTLMPADKVPTVLDLEARRRAEEILKVICELRRRAALKSVHFR
jgi:hypothetical protein